MIRAPEELKAEITNEAKRIGISANALVLQILDEWRMKKAEKPGVNQAS
jgi:predicted HicB family RNase H-like nuclease